MCNLYSNTRAREAMLRLFRVADNRATATTPLPAIFPSNLAPVVRAGGDGERELVEMNWGFIRKQKTKDGSAHTYKRVGNVRDDTILKSPFWKSSFNARRCLVPASSYCEPKGYAPAVWNWFSLLPRETGVERPLFAFPGIWMTYQGPLKKDGPDVVQDVYSFLTTTPNELTASINHERMPVLLTREEAFEAWLTGTAEEALNLARPFPAADMRIVQVGAERQDLLAA